MAGPALLDPQNEPEEEALNEAEELRTSEEPEMFRRAFQEGPESVSLEPESAAEQEAAVRNNPISGGVGRRVTSEEVANLAPESSDSAELFAQQAAPETPVTAPPVEGMPDQPVAGESKPPVEGEKSARQGGLSKLMGRFGLGGKKGNGAGGKVEEAKEEVKKQVVDQVKKEVKKRALEWAVEALGTLAGPEILVAILVIILVIGIIALVIGLAAAPRKQGDPAGAIASSSSELANLASTQNPDGLYCKELSPSITTTNGKKIMMPALEGATWEEEAAVAPGVLAPGTSNPGASLSFASTPRDNSVDQGKIGFTDDELKYYVNMRWMYTGWLFNGKTAKVGGEVKPTDYAGRNIGFARVTIDKDGKVTMGKIYKGKIAEAGPAPWTGTGYTDDNGKIVPSSTGILKPDQKVLWGPLPRIDTPPGYLGRVLGIAPPLHDLASADGGDVNGSYVVVGFLPDNTAIDGSSIPCTPVKYQGPGANSGATLGNTAQPLQVPGVKEAAAGECGTASALMVILYYNPSFHDPTVYNDTTQSSTGSSCLRADIINKDTQDKATDFVQAHSSGAGSQSIPEATFQDVQTSLTSGDPVIFYSEGVYDQTTNQDGHIFVLVGYNRETDTYWANNPVCLTQVGGQACSPHVDVGVDTINGHKLTGDFLAAHTGDVLYNGHSFFIRKKYLNL